MIKLSSEGYCIEAHKVGANTSALKFFIESYASSKGGWKGPLTWMATAFYPAINAMAYRRPLPPPPSRRSAMFCNTYQVPPMCARRHCLVRGAGCPRLSPAADVRDTTLLSVHLCNI